MQKEIYEHEGVKRCRIKVSEHETVDRVATDDDLREAGDSAKEHAQPEPTPKGKKKKSEDD